MLSLAVHCRIPGNQYLLLAPGVNCGIYCTHGQTHSMCSERVTRLLGTSPASGQAYLLEGDRRDALSGSLTDGRNWGPGQSVRLRLPEGGFMKPGTLYVFVPSECPGGDPAAFYLHGFQKSKCMGALRCENISCPFNAMYHSMNTHGAWQNGIMACTSKSGYFCGAPLVSGGFCNGVRYRVGLRSVWGADMTGVVYHGDHSGECDTACESRAGMKTLSQSLPAFTTVGARVSLGADTLMNAVLAGHKGNNEAAALLTQQAKNLLMCTAPDLLHNNTMTVKKELQKMCPSDIARQLRLQDKMIIVPYHKSREDLVPGPVATVTCHGCCRTEAEYMSVRTDPDYKYAAVWLLLACGNNALVLDLLDPEVVKMMHIPVSFDVQHPNKVKGHFSLGFFAYVPTVQRMVQLAMVMFPATDMQLGARAKCGDTVQANTEAKQALDIALKYHLRVAFPGYNWDSYEWSPRVARVSDEGYSGIQGLRSTDSGVVAEASCMFHFKQNTERLENVFHNISNFQHFQQSAAEIAHEPIPHLFWARYAALTEWVADLPVAEAPAIAKVSGFMLWHFSDRDRRQRLCKAFRPLGATDSSVAEIGHASQQHCGRIGLTLLQTIVTDAAFARRQIVSIDDMLKGKHAHHRYGPDVQRVVDMESCLTANNQSRFVNSSASAFPLAGAVVMLPLQNVPTHRPDKNTKDQLVRGNIIYTSKSKLLSGQIRINGIRFSKIDEGNRMFFCNVTTGIDLWAHEMHVDPADIDIWQQRLSYDELQRCRGVITTGRDTRFRMVQKSDGQRGTFDMRQTVYHRSVRSDDDIKHMQRALQLNPEDVVVLSARGTAENLCKDGQVQNH